MKKINLNDGLETIGVQSFDECINLKEITIPSTVNEIGLRAINWDCIEKTTVYSLNISQFTNLTTKNIIVECYKNTDLYDYCIEKGIQVESLGVYMPDDFAFKYVVNEDNTATITGYNFANVVNIDIPDTIDGHTVTSLKGMSGKFLETVTMPDTITSLGSCAFYGCEKLKSIKLSKNITSMPAYISGTVYKKHTGEFSHHIYKGVFENCYALEKVIVPSSMTHLEYRTFLGCGLEKIVIPASVTKIDDDSRYDINTDRPIIKYTNHNLIIYTYPDTAAVRFAVKFEIPYKILGDVSGNNEIDSSDALTLLNTVVGNSEKTDDMEVCDFVSCGVSFQFLNYCVFWKFCQP